MVQIGQRVHCILYGGKDGSVYGITGEQHPESVKNLGIVQTGGNAYFDIVWDNGTLSKGLPEAILHGVQWRIYPEVISKADIGRALEFAAAESLRRELEAIEAGKQRQAERERLAAEYTWLQQVGPGEYAQKTAAKNIRTELNRAFKGVKFSVKMQDSSINVTWEDGPVTSRVRAITDKYLYGHFDGMKDSYEGESTPWTNLFGDAHYVSTRRTLSDAVLGHALSKLVECLPHNMKDVAVPDIQVLRGYGQAPQVPGVNSDVRELVHALAQAWDALAATWSATDINVRHSWLLESRM